MDELVVLPCVKMATSVMLSLRVKLLIGLVLPVSFHWLKARLP